LLPKSIRPRTTWNPVGNQSTNNSLYGHQSSTSFHEPLLNKLFFFSICTSTQIIFPGPSISGWNCWILSSA
jgi:hypothetical protein